MFEGRDILALPEQEQRRLRGRRLAMVARVHLGFNKKAARASALDMLRAVQIPDPERRMNAIRTSCRAGWRSAVIAIALICDQAFVI